MLQHVTGGGTPSRSSSQRPRAAKPRIIFVKLPDTAADCTSSTAHSDSVNTTTRTSEQQSNLDEHKGRQVTAKRRVAIGTSYKVFGFH